MVTCCLKYSQNINYRSFLKGNQHWFHPNKYLIYFSFPCKAHVQELKKNDFFLQNRILFELQKYTLWDFFIFCSLCIFLTFCKIIIKIYEEPKNREELEGGHVNIWLFFRNCFVAILWLFIKCSTWINFKIETSGIKMRYYKWKSIKK